MMIDQNPRDSKDELARRGQEIFEQTVKRAVESEDPYKFVAIDIDSGEFAVDDDQLAAAHRLFEKNPSAQLWFRRVGFPVAEWFGGTRPTERARVRKKDA